jgi:hypothetical protein
MVGRYSAYRSGSDTVPPDVIDRILVGACAAVWLVLIGVSVAATVALADLGQGFHKVSKSPHTTWVLYVVIVVSALIIAGAIPVLLRARRTAHGGLPEPTAGGLLRGATGRSVRPGHPARRSMAELARRDRDQAIGADDEWSGAAVDRIWLRGTVALTGTMGAALIAVAAATYLMAVGHDEPSWIFYVLAGLITAAMPVIEVLHVRQLRRVVAAS